MIDMNDKDLFQKEVEKGLKDLEAGRVHPWEDFMSVFKCIAQGDLCLASDNRENAENYYRKAITISKDKSLASRAFYKLGLLNYNFEKPDILYSKLYFELAFDYGITDASYYLATIYEWEVENDNILYNSDQINGLYEYASENAIDEDVKKLALKKIQK